MSLFKLNAWFSHLVPNATSQAVGQLFKARDQVVVGGEDGLLSVFDPGAGQTTEKGTLLQQQFDTAIIFLGIGPFLEQVQGNVLAVLQTKRLVFYRLVLESDESIRLEEVVSHQLTDCAVGACVICVTKGETAANEAGSMLDPNKAASIAHVKQLLVLDSVARFLLFDGTQKLLSKALSPFLIPGPFCVAPFGGSVITGFDGKLAAIKFSSLAATKKVTPDWELTVGDLIVDLATIETAPVQPSIVALARRRVWCVTYGGTVRFTISLPSIGISLLVYKTLEATAGVQFLVGVASRRLLVYVERQLKWSCVLEQRPLSLQLASCGAEYFNLLSILSTNGLLAVGYLGTEPSLFKLPAADTRLVDFEAKKKELEQLELALKTAGESDQPAAVTAAESSSSGGDKMEVDLEGPTLSSVAEKGVRPSCTLRVSIRKSASLKSAQVNVHTEADVDRRTSLIMPGESVTLTFSVQHHAVLDERVVVTVSNGQEIVSRTVRLPLLALGKECAADRASALHRVTFHCSDAIRLHDVFPEWCSETTSQLGVQPIGDDPEDLAVSVFAAKNRLRLQSKSAHWLGVLTRETNARLRSGGREPTSCAIASTVSSLLDEQRSAERTAHETERAADEQAEELRTFYLVHLARLRASSSTSVASSSTAAAHLLRMLHDELVARLDQLIAQRRLVRQCSSRLAAHAGLLLSVQSYTDPSSLDGDAALCSARSLATPFDESLQLRLSTLVGSPPSGSGLSATVWESWLANVGVTTAAAAAASAALHGIVEEEEEEEGEAGELVEVDVQRRVARHNELAHLRTDDGNEDC